MTHLPARLRIPPDRCRGVPASAARRTCRISSSYEAISANDGHAAIARQSPIGGNGLSCYFTTVMVFLAEAELLKLPLPE